MPWHVIQCCQINRLTNTFREQSFVPSFWVAVKDGFCRKICNQSFLYIQRCSQQLTDHCFCRQRKEQFFQHCSVATHDNCCGIHYIPMWGDESEVVANCWILWQRNLIPLEIQVVVNNCWICYTVRNPTVTLRSCYFVAVFLEEVRIPNQVRVTLKPCLICSWWPRNQPTRFKEINNLVSPNKAKIVGVESQRKFWVPNTVFQRLRCCIKVGEFIVRKNALHKYLHIDMRIQDSDIRDNKVNRIFSHYKLPIPTCIGICYYVLTLRVIQFFCDIGKVERNVAKMLRDEVHTNNR